MVDYSVSSELLLKDNVTEVLLKIGRAFAKVNESVEKTQANLDRLAGFGEMALSLEKITAASRGLADSQAAIARSAKESAAAMEQMTRAAARAGGPRTVAGPTARPAAGRSGGGVHGAAMDVVIGGQMVGDAGMSMIEKAFMAEAEVQKILHNLQMNNAIDAAKTTEIRTKAEQLTRSVPGTTIAENLRVILDAFTAVGDIGEAMAGAEAMSRFNLVLKSLPGAHHGDSAFAGAQAIEVMQRFYNPKTHETDINAMNQQLAAMQQVALGTGGRASPEAYLAFAKQARMGGMLADDQFLYRDLPAMMIALSGSRSGTGDAAVFRQFAQGKMTEQAFNQLKQYGVIDPSAEWAHGHVQGMDKKLYGADEFVRYPVQWARDFLFKELAAHGVNPDDPKAKGLAAGNFASTNVGLGFLGEMLLGMSGINKEAGKIGGTTTDPMKILANDPMQKLREFEAAQNEFMVTLGSALMGPAIESLKGLTDVLHGLADWSKEHPNAAKDIAIAGAGMAVLAKGASELALVVFIGAPLVNGVTALATGATAAARAITGLVAAIGLIAKVGSDHETPENRDRLEQLNRARRGNGNSTFGAPTDGFDDMGRPITPGAFHPGQDGAHTTNIHVTLDGDVVGRAVVRRISNWASGPLMGPIGADPRRSYTPVEA